MRKLIAILSVVLFANQASADVWACAGWESYEYPDPFTLHSSSDGSDAIFVMSNEEDEVYVLHPDYVEEFLVEKDEMTVVAHLIDTRSGELDKSQALVLTQMGRRLEVILIDNIYFNKKEPFRNTDRTYCNGR